MSSYTHPLTLQVQELFIDSELAPDVTSLLLNEMDEYFVSKTLDHSNNLPSVVKNLYSIEDNELYSIISVCGFSGYEAVLMPTLQHFIISISPQVIRFMRDSGKYENHAFHAEVQKIHRLLKAVLELLKNSTRTTRRAIGHGVATQHIEFPDYETLKVFYECGRKVAYETATEAKESRERENDIYLCVHCNKYHQGRFKATNAPTVAEEVMLGRYKTAWRRYNKV